MTNKFAEFLDQILFLPDNGSEPPRELRDARARIAEAMGLSSKAETAPAISANDLAAFASGALSPEEAREFEQKLANLPGVAADVDFALDLLADVKAGAATTYTDVMPANLADEIERLPPTPLSDRQRSIDANAQPSAGLATLEVADRERSVLQVVNRLLASARRSSSHLIEVIAGLLPEQTDAWAFAPSPVFATRGPSGGTFAIEGAGANDGSSVTVTADDTAGTRRIEVVIRDFPFDHAVPTLVLDLGNSDLGASDSAGPVLHIDPEFEDDPVRRTRRLYYESNARPPGCTVAMMVRADGAVILAARVDFPSKT
jgi:hypothetical protein